jgi:two-component system, OmpR family, sensor kinase
MSASASTVRRGVPRRHRLQGVSLRARLVTGLIAVVFVGLMAANVIVFENIESFLIRGIDAQLVTAKSAVNNALSSRFGQVQFPSSTPSGTYGAAYTTAGVEEVSIQGFSGPKPELDAGTLDRLASGGSGAGQSSFTYLTLGSVGNPSFEYRVIGYPVSICSSPCLVVPTPGVAVVAIPLKSMNATLHQLILVDLIVGGLLLVLLGLLGYFVVRVGLRPLGDIEETAGAIAAGDLSRRVDLVEPATEVGRLGASLNVMLETIEHSFNEQRASENRLRQFLADASHELRTPVTSIRGYAELFRRGAAERPDDLATAMRRIEDESIRMGTLVDDLLSSQPTVQAMPRCSPPIARSYSRSPGH